MEQRTHAADCRRTMEQFLMFPCRRSSEKSARGRSAPLNMLWTLPADFRRSRGGVNMIKEIVEATQSLPQERVKEIVEVISDESGTPWVQ